MTARCTPTIRTERLLLRPLTLADAEHVFRYASDPEVARYVRFETHRRLEESRRFVASVMEKEGNGTSYVWAIIPHGLDHLIGACGFEVCVEHRRAELGFALNRKYWNRGFASEAAGAVLRFALELGLNRVEAFCFVENAASSRVLEKIGMRFEGILRQREYIKGVFRDLKVFALLSHENPRRNEPK